MRLDAAEEVGDAARAAAIARDMLSRERMWGAWQEMVHGDLLARATRAGAMSRGDFDREVAAFRVALPALYAKSPYFRDSTDRVRYSLWIHGYASTVITHEDAQQAMRHFDGDRLVTAPMETPSNWCDKATCC